MARKMLIDATHPEESRVAIIDDSILDDYDAETSGKKQFRGNIYLAKVIRVEPSLQAAFVEYGQNRHGFLPFAEIHPDYYRIPVGDRPAHEVELDEKSDTTPQMGADIFRETAPVSDLTASLDAELFRESQVLSDLPEITLSDDLLPPLIPMPGEIPADERVDLISDDETTSPRHKPYRYKIQEVIKRRQILLIQVVKEERGNKGAALTTYLSLPGRYCVLMPNAGHRSGGISRKIADVGDRTRLRDILNDLPIPEGISLIVRTAGQDRSKVEIRRDFEYLIRLWGEIREKTLTSIAPSLVYAEGDLIKRSIRDNYAKEIEEIIVEGDEGYKIAKTFMKNLIPSHAKRVKIYKDTLPLFQLYNVESQIDAIMSPIAPLPSGGSLVINATEALVAIDVNSGKSTRERHIDDTALKTNLEAADEVARQMRLRDLAGLIVIDFIDMSDQKNISAVEKRLREATRQDRARIQLGRISQFGLMELSRQRMRPSIIESNMKPCVHCHGTGMVRSIESTSLFILRAIESIGLAGRSAEIIVTVPAGIDLYLLNQKRSNIILIENRYAMSVQIQRDESLVPPDYRIDILVDRESLARSPLVITEGAASITLEDDTDDVDEFDTEEATDKADEASEKEAQPPETEQRQERPHRQRRGLFQNRRRNRSDNRPQERQAPVHISGEQPGQQAPVVAEAPIVPVLPSSPEQNVDQAGDQSAEALQQTKENQRRRNNRRRGRRRPPSERTTQGEGEIREPVASPHVEQQPKVVNAKQPTPRPQERVENKVAESPKAKEQPQIEVQLPKQKKRGFWSRLLDG